MATMAIAVFLSPKPPSTFPSSTRFSYPNPTRHRHLRLTNSPFPTSSFRNGSTRPETGCPVPLDQQPVNEYHNLSSSFPFNWAAGDAVELGSKLAVTGLSFALLVGLPVSWFGSGYGSSEPEPIRLLLGSVSSGIVATISVVLRMYLGWAYVGNRLLSATVEYEETGWYDGQIWVKTPEVLTRDRLLGSFQVKPVLSRLKNILNSLAAVLLACGILFIDYEKSESAYRDPTAGEDRVVAGVYNEESARSFEPDAFCGDPDLPPEIGK